MGRFVGSDPGAHLRQIAASERGDDADVRIGRTLLMRLGQPQYVFLRLDCGDVQTGQVFCPRFGGHRVTAELSDRTGQGVAVSLVVSLEQQCDIKHRLLQQSTFRANLVGFDCLQLEPEGDIEYIDVALMGRRAWLSTVGAGKGRGIAQNANGCDRQQSGAGNSDHAAARRDNVFHVRKSSFRIHAAGGLVERAAPVICDRTPFDAICSQRFRSVVPFLVAHDRNLCQPVVSKQMKRAERIQTVSQKEAGMTALRLIDYAAMDDRSLAALIAARDANAVRQVTALNNQRLFRAAWSILKSRADAEDAVQSAYLKAFAAITSFTGASSLSTWLTRIVINEALGKLRSDRRRRARLDPDSVIDLEQYREALMRGSATANDPDRELALKQVRQMIEQAVARLPAQYRLVFVLRDIEGMSVDEAAKALDVVPATVKTRLFRARQLLQRELEPELRPTLDGAFPFAGADCAGLTGRLLDTLAWECPGGR